MANQRYQMTTGSLESALDEVAEKLEYRAAQKGLGAMASNHEIYGIIRQETSEYEEAIHKRLTDDEKVEELKDIAVAALFGIASIRSGGVDW